MAGSALERLLRRQRLIVLACLALITGLAWWWILAGAGTGMSVEAMSSWAFPPPAVPVIVEDWSPGYAALMFAMWSIMMIAMMTPSAAPTILLFAHAHRHEHRRGLAGPEVAPTLEFAAGYLIAWMAFSLAATTAQWGLERIGVLHAMLMWSVDAAFSSALLIAAGLYQASPLKRVCLDQCRSPAQFIAEHYRPGRLGALSMGLRHGGFCVGCCWLLMSLLFVGGTMNLVWIAGLAILVLIEKTMPYGQWTARVTGVLMIAAGVWLALSTWA